MTHFVTKERMFLMVGLYVCQTAQTRCWWKFPYFFLYWQSDTLSSPELYDIGEMGSFVENEDLMRTTSAVCPHEDQLLD